MNTTSISITDIYRMLLPLSNDNKRWLGERLIADTGRKDRRHTAGKLIFPHINKEHKISQETMELVIGPMPKGFDFDKVKDEMWEEFAK